MVRVADLFALQAIDSELDTLQHSLEEARERLADDGGLPTARAEIDHLTQEERDAAHAQREAEAAQQQIHAELPLLFPTLSRPTPTRHTPAGFRRFPIPRRRS